MLLQVCFLRKTFFTILILAYIRFFLSMYSEMLHEIVPFSKNSIATPRVALQNLHVLHSERILEFVDSEVFGLRDDFIDLDLGDIEILPFKYFNNCVFGDLIFDLIIFNVFPLNFLANLSFLGL